MAFFHTLVHDGVVQTTQFCYLVQNRCPTSRLDFSTYCLYGCGTGVDSKFMNIYMNGLILMIFIIFVYIGVLK